MIKSTKAKIIFKGYAVLFLAEVMSLVLMLFMPFLVKYGVIVNIIYGFCTLSIYVALFGDRALKIGREDSKNLKRNESILGHKFMLLYAFLMMLPAYITAFINVLSKLEVISNFMPIYKLLNAFFIPIINIPAKSAEVADAGVVAFVLMFTLPLLLLASIMFFYNSGRKNVDFVEEFVYRK